MITMGERVSTPLGRGTVRGYDEKNGWFYVQLDGSTKETPLYRAEFFTLDDELQDVELPAFPE